MSAELDERVSDELGALEAILFDDEFKILEENGIPYAVEMVVHPPTGEKTDEQFVCVTLQVKFTPGYPDSSPQVTLRSPRGLDDTVLVRIENQIKEKLLDCLGQPVVFELIDVIREHLTNSNLPNGQCAICLYGFTSGDAFIKTQCYHYFHSHCLSCHIKAGQRNHKEEMDKLPSWQRQNADTYQATCPVCRSGLYCDVSELSLAPAPLECVAAAPFRASAQLRELQRRMAELLGRQRARGGTVEGEAPPLTITTAEDVAQELVRRRSPNDSPNSAQPAQVQNGKTSVAHPQNGKSSVSQPQNGRTTVSQPQNGKNSVSQPQNGKTSVAQPHIGKTSVAQPQNGKSSACQTQNGKPDSSNGGPSEEPESPTNEPRGRYRGPFRGSNRRGNSNRRNHQNNRSRQAQANATTSSTMR